MGAFAQEQLVGVASLENKNRGSNGQYRKLDLLYVSRAFRGQGIAKQLLDWSKKQAQSWGASKLYISATPSENTVDFYLSQEARLVEELDSELYAFEPEDIHLEIPL